MTYIGRECVSCSLVEETALSDMTYIWRQCVPCTLIEETARHLLNMPYILGRSEMFYLMMHSIHFVYSYIASNMW